MDKDVVAARVEELLAALDLSDDAGTLVVDYSAGMTKKIALASALIHAPRLLVLDEPFESVDPVSAANIRDILDRYVASGGTVIVSSHVMDLVQRMCDHVAVVAAGRLLAAGTVDEVRAGASPRRPLRPAGRRPQPDGGAGMVAHLLRLKLTLLRNSVRRSPWQLVGLAIGGLYALGLVGLAASWGCCSCAGRTPALAQTVVVLGGAAALLGWAVVPVAAVRRGHDPGPGTVHHLRRPHAAAADRAGPRRADRHPGLGHRAGGARHRRDLVPEPSGRGGRPGRGRRWAC